MPKKPVFVHKTPAPTQAGTVIRRQSEDRSFRGPTTVNEFSKNGFKAKDAGAPR